MLLQTRTRVLDGTFRPLFEGWYSGLANNNVDVMWMLIKDDQFRDNPPNPSYRPEASSHDQLIPLYTADRPEVQEVVAAMRAVLDEDADHVLIGELYLPPTVSTPRPENPTNPYALQKVPMVADHHRNAAKAASTSSSLAKSSSPPAMRRRIMSACQHCGSNRR